jgi:hypothetical protein
MQFVCLVQPFVAHAAFASLTSPVNKALPIHHRQEIMIIAANLSIILFQSPYWIDQTVRHIRRDKKQAHP